MKDVQNYVIRADYYDNGSVVPLAVTIGTHSYFISRITSNTKEFDGNTAKTIITCESGSDMCFWLCFSSGKWICKKMKRDE